MRFLTIISFIVLLAGCDGSGDAQAFQPVPPPDVPDVPEVIPTPTIPQPAVVDIGKDPVMAVVAGFGSSLHGDAFGGCGTSAARNFEALLRRVENSGQDVAFTELPCEDEPWKVGPLHNFSAMQERFGIPDKHLLGLNWMRELVEPADISEVNPTAQTNTVLQLDALLASVNDGGPVNVIAHSWGAIAVDYCRQVGYCATVNEIVRLGPPARGSVSAYFFLNGEVQGSFASAWAGEVLLEYMKAGLHDGLITDTNFVRAYIPSIEQLLPIDPYIKRSVGFFGAVQTIPVEDTCFVNTFLQEFNMAPHNDIPSFTIYGTDLPTLEVLRTYNALHVMTDCQEQRWPDGSPGIFTMGDDDDVYADGDGTVTAASATALDIAYERSVPFGMHSVTLLTAEDALQAIDEFFNRKLTF